MKFLIFDTETTGLPRFEKNPFHYPDYWPHMVQLAWIVAQEEEVLFSQNSLIIPERYTIPQSATAIHGITHERALAEGKPILSVLNQFSEAVSLADVIVGHNVLFDRNIVTAEFARAQQNAPILGLPYHCTMKTTSDICRIPHKSNRQGYKWPTLKELHMHLFGTDFDDAHDALADVYACMRCYLELKKQGLFTELRMKPDKSAKMRKKIWENPYY